MTPQTLITTDFREFSNLFFFKLHHSTAAVTIHPILFSASHNWDNWCFNANRGHKIHWPQTNLKSSSRLSNQITTQPSQNSLFMPVQKCSSADVKFKTHAFTFQPLSLHRLVYLSVCMPSYHSLSALSRKCWNCAENMATCQGRERTGGNPREREKDKVRACVEQGGREGGPMGSMPSDRLPCCSPVVLPGHWSHPPCSLRPPSPPPPRLPAMRGERNHCLWCATSTCLPPALCAAVWKPQVYTHRLPPMHDTF